MATALSLLVVAVQLVHTAVTARIISVADFGAFALALTVVQVLGYFATAGLGVTVTRSNLPRELVARMATLSALVGGVIVAGAAVAVGRAAPAIFHTPSAERLIDYLAVLPLFQATAIVYLSLLRRDGRLVVASKVESFGVVVGLAVSGSLVLIGEGTRGLVAGQVCGAVVTLMLSVLITKRVWWPGYSKAAARDILFFATHVGAQNLSHYVIYGIPLWSLGHSQSPSVAGQYARGSNLVTLPLNQVALAATKTLQATYPRVVSTEAASRVAAYGLEAITLIRRWLVPLLASAAMTAPYLLPFLLGPGWRPAASVASWLCAYAAVNLVYIVIASAAEAHRLMPRVWVGIAVFLVVEVGLLLVLSPGVGGTVAALLTAQVCAVAVHLIAVGRVLGWQILVRAAVTFVIACVAWAVTFGALVRLADRVAGSLVGPLMVVLATLLLGVARYRRSRGSAQAR